MVLKAPQDRAYSQERNKTCDCPLLTFGESLQAERQGKGTQEETTGLLSSMELGFQGGQCSQIHKEACQAGERRGEEERKRSTKNKQTCD